MKTWSERVLLVVFVFCFQTGFAQRYVIGSRYDAGFFSNFFGVLNHLCWCKKTGNTPVVYWGQDSPYWQESGYNGSLNVWEYYFEPVSTETASEKEPRDHSFAAQDVVPFRDIAISREMVLLANQIIHAYVRVNNVVQGKIDSFFEHNMAGKKTIGIHLRGLSKATEIKVVDPFVIFARANDEADMLGDCQFLVATDEYRLLELAQESLNRPVIYYPCQRAYDAKPLFFSSKITQKAILGEDVLIEALLLSQCDLFLHTYSNVSAAVLYFNPALRSILFT